MMLDQRKNLLGLNGTEIMRCLESLVEKPYRARQVAEWIHHRDARSFGEMTNLPLSLRSRLEESFCLEEPAVVHTTESPDGSRKYLFRFSDGATVEGVSMPQGRKATFCLSSQTGCSVGCRFCVTGALGPGRDLDEAEMLGQYRIMRRDLPPEIERVNIVFMGMGEPLLNREHLGRALDALYESVSPKRITVSTAGIIPGIQWLGGLPRRPKLAISLNAPDQKLREELMPVSRRYPLSELMEILRDFPLEGGRRITFEYVLIRDLNDRPRHARELRRLLHGVPAKINIIPLNEDAEHIPDLHRPSDASTEAFAESLRHTGLVVTIRRSRGLEVAAACGQLKSRHRFKEG